MVQRFAKQEGKVILLILLLLKRKCRGVDCFNLIEIDLSSITIIPLQVSVVE